MSMLARLRRAARCPSAVPGYKPCSASAVSTAQTAVSPTCADRRSIETAATPAPYNGSIQPNADAEFPAQRDRYHLYVAYNCPFASRTLAARNLKGLQDVVSLSVAHPIFQKTKPNDDSDTHR
ncbi:hypothetical protein BBJ28_00025925, partial [Nothophytophthora sp. Chile5]